MDSPLGISQRTIAINGRFLTQPATGVQRYANELLRAWDGMLATGEIDPHEYRFELILPRGVEPPDYLQMISSINVGRLKGNLWEQIDLPWYTRGKYLFNPCNIAPVLKMGQAVTIHDASTFAVPQSYSRLFRIKYLLVLSILARTANVILTVSEFAKKELVKYLHIAPQKIHVIPSGSDHILRTPPDLNIINKFCLSDRPYLMAVGSNAVHKNYQILNQVRKMIPISELDIVIAGGDFGGWFKTTRDNGQTAIKKIGYVTDSELRALYQSAIGFVFPSLYEGFGIPPLEAMACGCPVIASKAASLPEICGDAAIYFDPNWPEELADKITLLMKGSSCQEFLRKQGFQQSKKYMWDRTARETWKTLQDNLQDN